MPATVARPTNEDRIRAALWFAERGFGIFPVWSTRRDGACRCPAAAGCTAAGKHPITPNGFQDATRDESRIRTFLAAGSEPNWGMVCPDGVFALDVDGDDGPARLAELEARHGALPPTLRTKTANGQHVFLRWPEGHPRPLRQMFGFVTRWGSGKLSGYVIGPRSVHASGAQYEPAEGAVADIATLPEAWAEACAAPAESVTVGASHDPADVAVGHRHDWLRDTARYYAGVVRDPDALFAAIWAENMKLAEPKDEDAVRRAIGDVLTKFAADPVEEDPETGAVQRVVDELGILPPTALGTFPPAPSPVAFGGLIGECVEDMARGTDASLVGLLASFLAICGAMVPASAYARGEQTTSPFLALVGESSIGRKGTAMHRALGAARNTWQADHINAVLLDGLNSGEALVSALHERRTSSFNAGRPAVALVFEDEFASMLQSRGREGSTLDAKMRLAFDGSSLSNRRRAESQVVQPPYWLPALAAITPVELRSMLDAGATRNGSANRWLYVPVVKRDVNPPDEPPILAAELQEALTVARDHGKDHRLQVHPEVGRTLTDYSEHVMARAAGVGADLVRRYQTIAVRVALIHAAVERSPVIEPQHLERALALTEYARGGIDWVFGMTIGNRDADLLLRHLQDHGGLRKTTITRQIIRDPIRQQDAIDELVRLRYAEVVSVTTGGRSARELRLMAPRGGLFPHFPRFRQLHSDLYAPSWKEAPSPRSGHAQDGLERSWKEAGNKQERSRTEGSEASPVDHTTGETQSSGEATWAKPCSAYMDHRSEHRRRSEGWVCVACHPEEEGPR